MWILGSSRVTCILTYVTAYLLINFALRSILCLVIFITRLSSSLNHPQAYFMFKSMNTVFQTKPGPSSPDVINCLSFYFLDPFICLLDHPSTPASGTLPTEQQHNGYFVNTLFILSTRHCLSLLIAVDTPFLSRFPLLFLFSGHNTSAKEIVYKYGHPIIWVLPVSRT